MGMNCIPGLMAHLRWGACIGQVSVCRSCCRGNQKHSQNFRSGCGGRSSGRIWNSPMTRVDYQFTRLQLFLPALLSRAFVWASCVGNLRGCALVALFGTPSKTEVTLATVPCAFLWSCAVPCTSGPSTSWRVKMAKNVSRRLQLI